MKGLVLLLFLLAVVSCIETTDFTEKLVDFWNTLLELIKTSGVQLAEQFCNSLQPALKALCLVVLQALKAFLGI